MAIENNYYYYIDNYKNIKFISSGLVILSKYKLFNLYSELFNNSCGEDTLAEKGFIAADFYVDKNKYTVINTHLNATAIFSNFKKSTKIRNKQLKQIQNFMSSTNNKNIIIGGDFNMKPRLSKLSYKINRFNKKLPLDYILYISKNKKFKTKYKYYEYDYSDHYPLELVLY